MSGLNLHRIVRGAINAVHPDKDVIIYQSMGQKNISGVINPIYIEGQPLKAQIQTESDSALFHADRVGQNEINRKIYLYSTEETPISGVIRTLERGGDILQLPDKTYWLVTAVLENFAGVGWVSVRATMQVKLPDFSFSPGYEEDGG